VGGVGCGAGASTEAGAGGTTSSAGLAAPKTPTSRRQVLTAADAVCERANKKLTSSPPKGAKPDEIAAEILANAKVEDQTVAELERLNVPADLSGPLRSVTKYRRSLADDLISLAGAMKRGDETALTAISYKKEKTHDLLLISAGRAGFKHCGLT
jgi:hypothetical protein